MDLAVLEAPAAQVRIIGPPPGWVFGRALPQRTESLRSAPIIAASSDDQILPGCPMFRGPELEEHILFASNFSSSDEDKTSNLKAIFARFIAEAFSVSTETADRPPPRQRIEPRVCQQH